MDIQTPFGIEEANQVTSYLSLDKQLIRLEMTGMF
jgi:hypothetical protein